VKKLLIGVGAMLVASAAWAQSRPAGSDVDPLRCWWRTTSGAVRVGETFSLVLTCAVLQNEVVQVVPDETRLDATVVQMAPFEVVGGAHPTDLYAPNRRFFQYEYRLRVISPDVIGKDILIPDPQIHYRINSTVAANTALQGRDLTYVMPPQTVRVLSLVAADAPDIRDAGNEGFSAAEQLGFRANVLRIGAVTAMALGALVIVGVVARVAVRTKTARTAGVRGLTDAAILRAAARELAEVQRQKEAHDWNDALVARALAATRITASAAVRRPVTQRLEPEPVADAGSVMARSGPWRKPRAISGAATSEDIGRELERLPPAARPERRQLLEDLQHALRAFTSVQYARAATFDRTLLDEALSRAMAATKRAKRGRSPYTGRIKGLSRVVEGV
jgi:hypothetical protein